MTVQKTVAILETDTPVPKVESTVGSYGDIFEALLRNAGLPAEVGITKHKVVDAGDDAYPPLESISGIVITGSKHNSYESIPWIVRLVEYVQRAVQKGVPIVGICFGHQIVGRALEVPVGKNPKGWEIASQSIQLTDKGKALLGPYVGDKSTINIMQMHQDVVFELPPNTELLAYSDVCKVQGFYRKGKILTFQGHPEFTQFITSAIIDLRHSAGVFDDAFTEKALADAKVEHNGLQLARAMVDLLQETI
uniref:ARAD1D29062p n=1 Tax=Blastobotrys adeninivorans TaxID=409370 RepID=A0A060TB90_BLAAD